MNKDKNDQPPPIPEVGLTLPLDEFLRGDQERPAKVLVTLNFDQLKAILVEHFRNRGMHVDPASIGIVSRTEGEWEDAREVLEGMSFTVDASIRIGKK